MASTNDLPLTFPPTQTPDQEDARRDGESLRESSVIDGSETLWIRRKRGPHLSKESKPRCRYQVLRIRSSRSLRRWTPNRNFGDGTKGMSAMLPRTSPSTEAVRMTRSVTRPTCHCNLWTLCPTMRGKCDPTLAVLFTHNAPESWPLSKRKSSISPTLYSHTYSSEPNPLSSRALRHGQYQHTRRGKLCICAFGRRSSRHVSCSRDQHLIVVCL